MDTCSTPNKKIRKACIRIVVYVLMLMMLHVIHVIRKSCIKIPLFHCNWVDGIKGVVKDKYGFISIDHNRHGYKSEPFELAKHIAQVF
jgi:hypothetical protein